MANTSAATHRPLKELDDVGLHNVDLLGRVALVVLLGPKLSVHLHPHVRKERAAVHAAVQKPLGHIVQRLVPGLRW